MVDFFLPRTVPCVPLVTCSSKRCCASAGSFFPQGDTNSALSSAEVLRVEPPVPLVINGFYSKNSAEHLLRLPQLVTMHCTEVPNSALPEMLLRGLVPNSYIHVSVGDIPTICPPIYGTLPLQCGTSYKQFPPTPCFVHRVDVKPSVFLEYRSTEPLFKGAESLTTA